LRDEGKIREIGVALGPANRLVERGSRSIRKRPSVQSRPWFNILEQEPVSRSAEQRVASGEVGLIAAYHGRRSVRKVTPRPVFPEADHRAHRNREQ